jgi:parallel beta-helix repeat protein
LEYKFNKKIIYLSIAVLLVSSLGFINHVNAQYQGDITINSDGTVTPSEAPIAQTGNTYTLTSDINGSITLNTNNIVLNGNGHTLTVSSKLTYGILLNDLFDVTIEHFVITGQYGIEIDEGGSNTIKNNVMRSVDNVLYSMIYVSAAIFISESSSNIISGNIISNDLIGIHLFSSSQPSAYNQIYDNEFNSCWATLSFYNSSNNDFFHNNFSDNTKILSDNGYLGYGVASVNKWDDGQGQGNYWSDYNTR